MKEIKVYDFDMLFMNYGETYLFCYTDNITRKIKYRLEDYSTENSRQHNFSKYIEDDITVERYLDYIKEV